MTTAAQGTLDRAAACAADCAAGQDAAGIAAASPSPALPHLGSGGFGFRPALPLGAFVALLWTSARPAGLPHAREWQMPSGRADLVLPLDRSHLHRHQDATDLQGWRLAGGLLQGATLLPSLRDTRNASVVVGAQFHVHGLGGVLPGPADALAGQAVALDDLWPGWSDRLRSQVLAAGALHQPQRRLALFAQALAARLLRTDTGDAMVPWALARLQAGAAVGAVQRTAGCSPTTFIRRIRQHCGLTPQQVIGLQRFQQALQLGHTGLAWADTAAEAGYADQAHLHRAFRRFAGTTPARWRALATPAAQHMACP